MKRLICLIIAFLAIQIEIQGYLDLEKLGQSFVLETKQIHIQGYPDAFNPSIIRWNDHLLMSFRIRDPLTKVTNQFGLIILDQNFNPIGDPQLLVIPYNNSIDNPARQDPRLITCGETIYIVYNDMVRKETGKVRRMFISKLRYDGTFRAETPQVLLHFEGENESLNEKNWVPFNYMNQLLLAYSLFPHRILVPLPDSTICETLATSHSNVTWNWGQPRGGSQALLMGQSYLGFFHSSMEMKTMQSKGKKISHYFMGAYTFSPDPPFNITQISPEPIFSKTFYEDSEYKTWKPLRVVFPGGFIFDENYIWVVYGRQDHEVWVVKLDRKGLLNSLISVDKNN